MRLLAIISLITAVSWAQNDFTMTDRDILKTNNMSVAIRTLQDGRFNNGITVLNNAVFKSSLTGNGVATFVGNVGIGTTNPGNKFDVANITNYTYHPADDNPDGLTKFNPMKLYCPDRLISPMNSIGKSIQLYYDDFEFWINKKP